MKRGWLAVVMLSLLLPLPGQAADEVSEPQAVAASLMTVRPGPKRYFHIDYEAGCPAPKPACRRKAFLIPGDVLIAYEMQGQFTRVEYTSVDGERSTFGWIESAGLMQRPVVQQPSSAWLGHWSASEENIEITATKKAGRLHAAGQVTWGANDPDRVARGGINLGDFSGDFTPKDGSAEVVTDSDPDACRVTLKLLGPYLLTSDNLNCGGHNVSFNRALRKAAAKAR